ncbi:hypothetical protein OAH87_06460 [Marinomonas sp.]|nr:hypothetical protein [Marinomonas sp.]MDB4838089.1 hypothetical protein [Marinomonas sp.]
MFYLFNIIDGQAAIKHNVHNITVTLSAFQSSGKKVTRNLGGFFTPKILYPSALNQHSKMRLCHY